MMIIIIIMVSEVKVMNDGIISNILRNITKSICSPYMDEIIKKKKIIRYDEK
jgi:hypothetical protein